MEEKNTELTMLDLMHQAAFRAEKGIITHVNPAAAQYWIQPGTAVESLLSAGREEYTEFTQGCLYVSLQLQGQTLGATVAKIRDAEIFVLEQISHSQQLQALALAAVELRGPLSGMIAAGDLLLPELATNASPELQEYAAQINRRTMQMQRIVCNMSDCCFYAQSGSEQHELIDIVSLLEELLSRAAHALQAAGMHLTYQLPAERIFTLANSAHLERAVYNLISNAAKFSPVGAEISVQLVRKGERLALSVTDPGCGISQKGDVFTRYQRQPGLEDSRNGIGLGMVMIRSAAAAHGGAVLIDAPDGQGTRVTMTLAIRQRKDTAVRSPMLRIDYAGERDHCLLELSDVLPTKLYEVEPNS